MTTNELEEKLNRIDPDVIMRVKKCNKTHKKDDIMFYKGYVYVFNIDQTLDRPVLLFTLVPSADFDDWIVTTVDSIVNAFEPDPLGIYIKMLELIKQFLVEKRPKDDTL